MTAAPMIRVFTTIYIVALSFVPAALGRTWTDQTGQFKVEAELVTVRQGKVYLEKSDGQVSSVPLERLSSADLTYLAGIPKYESQVRARLPKSKLLQPASSPAQPKVTVDIDELTRSGSVGQFRSDRWGYKGLAFSNDGAYLVTLGSDNVTVMDIEASTKTLYKLDGGSRSALTFSPDGKRLLAGAYDGNVLVWQFDGKGELKPERQFSIFKGEIKSIVVSPDNQHVLTTHSSSVACLWDIDTGKVLARFNDFNFGSLGATRFSRYGGQAIVTDGQIAAVIDINKRKIIQRTSLSRGSGQSAAISSDGSLIASGRTYDIHYFQTQSGQQPSTSKGKEIAWSASFSPSGELLVSGGLGKVSIWDTETGKQLREYPMGDSGYVKYVAFSPDGLHFAAIGAPIGKLVEVFRLPSQEHEH
ncbi:hypothetical protein Q31b_32150 [Novipirellula aureliae]|uniref:SLA1 homology domain-containing protein n=1 Tax=Novipirellula aureliae TaxID=2527966 RepID=A0A5C6DYF3_9BACT|nr:SHD1 domain-containing protein [Novipirellula aureliae]TWU39899.1 hypothetical protein Q31b_32150 [Novipirellula aureliae]